MHPEVTRSKDFLSKNERHCAVMVLKLLQILLGTVVLIAYMYILKVRSVKRAGLVFRAIGGELRALGTSVE